MHLPILPHSDVVVATRPNVSTVAAQFAVLVLALVNFTISRVVLLPQASSNTFSLIIEIELTIINLSIKLLLTKIQLLIIYNSIVLLNFKQADRAELPPACQCRLLLLTLFVERWFRFEKTDQVLGQLRFYVLLLFYAPILNFHIE